MCAHVRESARARERAREGKSEGGVGSGEGVGGWGGGEREREEHLAELALIRTAPSPDGIEPLPTQEAGLG